MRQAAIVLDTYGTGGNRIDGATSPFSTECSSLHERKSQMKTNLLRGATLAAVLVLAGVAVAQRPVENIDGKVHPHLAASQHHLAAAWQEAETARADNHDQLGGHAEKALEHMLAADRELKEAAEYSNAHHH
jgi:hypothetical protein